MLHCLTTNSNMFVLTLKIGKINMKALFVKEHFSIVANTTIPEYWTPDIHQTIPCETENEAIVAGIEWCQINGFNEWEL